MRSNLAMFAILTFICGLTLATADAGEKAKDLLIGKWKAVDSKNNKIVEFTKDGKMIGSTTNASGKTVKATDSYKFIDDEKIEITVDVLGKKVMQTIKIKVTKDELITTNDFGKEEKHKRTK